MTVVRVRESKGSKDPAGVASVTVMRAHHPLVGQRLRVLGRMRRHGRLELLLELADGSKRLIPAAWTDQGGQSTQADAEQLCGSTTATVGSVSDLLAACGLVSALSARAAGDQAAGDRGQAARQSPSKEDCRAACAAQSAAGPGSGATGDPVSPAPRRRRRGGDHAAGPSDRQRRYPGGEPDHRAADGHAAGKHDSGLGVAGG